MEPKKKRLRKRKLYQMEIDESLDNGVFAISLVEDPAIEELFVYMSKDHQMVKLAEVDKEKRILFIILKAMYLSLLKQSVPHKTYSYIQELFMVD